MEYSPEQDKAAVELNCRAVQQDAHPGTSIGTQPVNSIVPVGTTEAAQVNSALAGGHLSAKFKGLAKKFFGVMIALTIFGCIILVIAVNLASKMLNDIVNASAS